MMSNFAENVLFETHNYNNTYEICKNIKYVNKTNSKEEL